MIAVDAAGAVAGGAARLLRELDVFLDQHPSSEISVLGRGRRLTPQWLMEREFHSRRSAGRVALNNASFIGGSPRTVLLRNALHFMTADELRTTPMAGHRDIKLQTPVIRTLARKADLVIVPSSDMAERVAHFIPSLTNRLRVRFHPVSPTWESRLSNIGPRKHSPKTILMPILKSAFKHLDESVAVLASALLTYPEPVILRVTAEPHEYAPPLRHHPHIDFIGRQTAIQLEKYWSSANGIFFPTTLESFGYPLAEARCRGLPVIGMDTSLNREIAGEALCPMEHDVSTKTVTTALDCMLSKQHLDPDPAPFSSYSYFNDLLYGGQSTGLTKEK